MYLICIFIIYNSCLLRKVKHCTGKSELPLISKSIIMFGTVIKDKNSALRCSL